MSGSFRPLWFPEYHLAIIIIPIISGRGRAASPTFRRLFPLGKPLILIYRRLSESLGPVWTRRSEVKSLPLRHPGSNPGRPIRNQGPFRLRYLAKFSFKPVISLGGGTGGGAGRRHFLNFWVDKNVEYICAFKFVILRFVYSFSDKSEHPFHYGGCNIQSNLYYLGPFILQFSGSHERLAR